MKRQVVTLMMTRPRDAAREFVSQLPVGVLDRVTPLFAPLIEVEPIIDGLDLMDARGIIFSSANGVKVASELTLDRGLPCYCIGEATTLVAQNLGWSAQFMGSTAGELVAAMPKSRPDTPLLHLSGVHSRGNIAKRLTARGCPASRQAIYNQHLVPLSEEVWKKADQSRAIIAPLFSPRTARHFVDQIPKDAKICLIALSEAVAEPLYALKNSDLVVANEPTAAAMVKTIENTLNRVCRVEGDGAAD